MIAFVAIGPPVGGLILGLIFDGKLLCDALSGPPHDLDRLHLLFVAPPVLMLGSYLIGGVAAFVCGVVYALLALALGFATRLAACISAIIGTVVSLGLMSRGLLDAAPLAAVVAALSIPAALVARRVAHEGGSEPA